MVEGLGVRLTARRTVRNRPLAAWGERLFLLVSLWTAILPGTCPAEPPEASVDLSLSDTVGPTKPNVFGQNVVFFQGGYCGHLIDESTQKVYPEVVKALREERPTLLRYPGGLYGNFFHWQETIGPVSERKRQSINGELPDQLPLLGVDEFLRLAATADDCGALMIVNVSKSSRRLDGTAKEAAAWVAYCNAMPDNEHFLGIDETGRDWKTAGYWAAQRARNGHPAPYRVEHWELGNELNQAAPSVYKSTEYLLTAEEYARRAAEFIREMKAVDPGIKIGVHGYSECCQPAANPRSFKGGGPWVPVVVGGLGGKFDFFVWHHYNAFTIPGIPDRDVFCKAVLGWSLAYCEPDLKRVRSWLREMAPSSQVWLTEYCRFPGIVSDESRGRNLVVALGCADFIMQNVMSPDLDAAQHFGFNTGGMGCIFAGNDKTYFGRKVPEGTVVRFPVHWVFAMFGSSTFRESDGAVLNPKTTCGRYEVMGYRVPELRAVAAVNRTGTRLDLLLLNKRLSGAINVTVRVSGGKSVKSVQATELNTWSKESEYPLFDSNDSAPTVYVKRQPSPAIARDRIEGSLAPHSLIRYSCELE
jgi:alpha-L-arabinofuranosidase